VPGGTQLGDRVVEVLGVPEHERVEREAERAELIFLAFTVGLAPEPPLLVEQLVNQVDAVVR
jgi:hypothetical protein